MTNAAQTIEEDETTGVTIHIELDTAGDAEDPTTFGDGDYRVAGFNRRWTSYVDPDKFRLHPDASGHVTTDDIGLRRKLAVGTAFILSCYQHSGVVWSLKGSGPQCQFDTAQVAGILFVPRVRGENLEKRAERARDFLKTYNAWCNGEVYGLVAKRDGEVIDSLWGFYGYDDAKANVADFQSGLTLEDGEEVTLAD